MAADILLSKRSHTTPDVQGRGQSSDVQFSNIGGIVVQNAMRIQWNLQEFPFTSLSSVGNGFWFQFLTLTGLGRETGQEVRVGNDTLVPLPH